MPILEHAFETALATLLDVAPIVALLVAFQVLVIRRPPPHLRRIVVGCGCVLAGLVLFLMGLEKALFPLGEAMATQLTARDLVGATAGGGADWRSFVWVYVFAAAIGFATTLAEPSLIAVGMKAQEVSGGAVHGWGLRIAVAVGVALGVALGAFRIVTGTPLAYYIMAGYAIVIVQTVFAPRTIVALAYDSGGGGGGVTTSTVTVPVVAALGLGLAGAIPGRSPLIDGFGLIAFASVFPIISVLGYAMLSEAFRRLRRTHDSEEIR